MCKESEVRSQEPEVVPLCIQLLGLCAEDVSLVRAWGLGLIR